MYLTVLVIVELVNSHGIFCSNRNKNIFLSDDDLTSLDNISDDVLLAELIDHVLPLLLVENDQIRHLANLQV